MFSTASTTKHLELSCTLGGYNLGPCFMDPAFMGSQTPQSGIRCIAKYLHMLNLAQLRRCTIGRICPNRCAVDDLNRFLDFYQMSPYSLGHSWHMSHSYGTPGACLSLTTQLFAGLVCWDLIPRFRRDRDTDLPTVPIDCSPDVFINAKLRII